MSCRKPRTRLPKAVAAACAAAGLTSQRLWSSSATLFCSPHVRQVPSATGHLELQQIAAQAVPNRASASGGWHRGSARGSAQSCLAAAGATLAAARALQSQRSSSSRAVRRAESTGDQDAAGQRFSEWIKARGGNMENVEVQDIDGMRGLVASRDIAEGESIIEIPLEASIDITATGSNDPGANAVNLLQALKEDADALEPYATMLPGRDSTDMMRMPDFYSEEELRMLQCPLVVEKTQRRRQLCASKAAESSLEAEAVTWALCTCAQRAFSVLSPVDGLLRLMLPGIDLFNHDAHAQHTMKVRWDLEGYVTAMFKVVAGSPIKKGEEIRICYGGSPFRPDGCGGDCTGDIALNNSQYLQRYGFVDECIGTTMVDGKWLVSDDAEGVRASLAETSIEADEAVLTDGSLTAAARTAVQFRRHLKVALAAQQEADRQAAKAAANKSEAEKQADEAKQRMEEQEAKIKAENAAEAKKQLMKAVEE